MNNQEKNILSELSCYAKNELTKIVSHISGINCDKTSMLVELVRYFDTRTVMAHISEHQIKFDEWFDYYIIHLGYMPSLEILLKLTKESYGIGLAESSVETRSFIYTLLQSIGKIQLLCRHINMTKSKLLTVKKDQNMISFSSHAGKQGLELFERLERNNIKNSLCKYFGEEKQEERKIPNYLRQQMHDLVYKWKDHFIGYETSPEIDEFFLVEALNFADDRKCFAGIHPDFRLGPIKGKHLLIVEAMLLSMNLKHLAFVTEYLHKYPNSKIYNLVTVWFEKKVLVDSISYFSGLDRKTVYHCLRLLSATAMNITSHAQSFKSALPTLVDVNRSLTIRTVSSAFYDMLFFSAQELRLNHQSLWNKNLLKREDWFRNDLYALFMGNRYIQSAGAVQLIKDGTTYTDIDAAIVDIETGTLAIFELKWHEPFGDNEKERLSRALNLKRGVKRWFSSVTRYLNDSGVESLRRNLFNAECNIDISKILYFVVARHHARFTGISFDDHNASVVSWNQFVRIRLELGSVDNTFESISQAASLEEDFSELKSSNKPINFQMGKYQVTLNGTFFVMEG